MTTLQDLINSEINFWNELAYINLQLFEGMYIKLKTQILDVVFLIIV
jgi:hypothetical protein